MTSNQMRAIRMAGAILNGRLSAADLTDHDWILLLLAAGVNNASSPASVVSARVLAAASSGTGYFKRPLHSPAQFYLRAHVQAGAEPESTAGRR